MPDSRMRNETTGGLKKTYAGKNIEAGEPVQAALLPFLISCLFQFKVESTPFNMDIHLMIAALALTTAFYAAYLSKQFMLRRRGIRSDRLAKGDKPANVYRLEVALMLVTFTMPLVQYAGILFRPHFFVPLQPPIWLAMAGAAVSMTGVVLFIAAITAMRDNWRAGIDQNGGTEIVTSGIYRWSRNPAFVGFDLFYIGIALIYPSVAIIAMTLIGIVLFHLQILNEESCLEQSFGRAYTDYKHRTRRYLGIRNGLR